MCAPEGFRREVGATAVEFERGLRLAVAGVVSSPQPGVLRVDAPAAVLEVALTELPERCIGQFRIPVLCAHLRFLSGNRAARQALLARIDLALSRSGPLGELGLLYSPTAMVIAQTVLVVPLMAAIARQTVEDAWRDYEEELTAMHFRWFDSVRVLLHDCRHSLMVAVLAGLGRAMSEVGAVMIVGGNIDRSTRTMTTAIALETSKGDLPLAVALGLVLLAVILILNGLAYGLRLWAMRRYA